MQGGGGGGAPPRFNHNGANFGQHTPGDDVICQCGQPATKFTSRKENANKGREFYTCGNRQGGCRFFQWADGLGNGGKGGKGKKGAGNRGNFQRAGITRHAADKKPIDVQIIGWGEVVPELGVPPPALQVTFPSEGMDELVSALQEIQGVTPLHVEAAKGVRVYRWEDYKAVAAVFNNDRFGNEVDVIAPPTTLFASVGRELAVQRPEIDESWWNKRVPIAFSTKLYPFQREGVEYAVRHGGRCLIADDMGLGKTLQAIALLACYREEWPALVVTPAHLAKKWEREVLEYLTFLSANEVMFIGKSKDAEWATETAAVFITTYDIATRAADKADGSVGRRHFKVVVCDEAHMLKNPKSARCTKLMPVIKNADRAIMLTGTPTLNRPIELFPYLQGLLSPHIKERIFSNMYEFARRYCDMKDGHFGKDMSGFSNLIELQYIMKLFCMIRREKMAVLADELPPKHRHQVHISITEEERQKMLKHYSHIADRFKNLEDIADESDNDPNAMAAAGMGMSGNGMPSFKAGGGNNRSNLIYLYNATSTAKHGPVCEYIRQQYSTGEKVLIFGHHADMLNAVEKCVVEICNERNQDDDRVAEEGGMWQHVRIDGQMPVERKQQLADSFQNNPNCKFAVLSIFACASGFTLHSSNVVVFAELVWTPGWLLQAEDRVHRIGQTRDCHIKYLLAKGTSDELLWPMINRKLRVVGAATNDQFIDDDDAGADQEWAGGAKEFHRACSGKLTAGKEMPMAKGEGGFGERSTIGSVGSKNGRSPPGGRSPESETGPRLRQTKLNFVAIPRKAASTGDEEATATLGAAAPDGDGMHAISPPPSTGVGYASVSPVPPPPVGVNDVADESGALHHHGSHGDNMSTAAPSHVSHTNASPTPGGSPGYNGGLVGAHPLTQGNTAARNGPTRPVPFDSGGVQGRWSPQQHQQYQQPPPQYAAPYSNRPVPFEAPQQGPGSNRPVPFDAGAQQQQQPQRPVPFTGSIAVPQTPGVGLAPPLANRPVPFDASSAASAGAPAPSAAPVAGHGAPVSPPAHDSASASPNSNRPVPFEPGRGHDQLAVPTPSIVSYRPVPFEPRPPQPHRAAASAPAPTRPVPFEPGTSSGSSNRPVPFEPGGAPPPCSASSHHPMPFRSEGADMESHTQPAPWGEQERVHPQTARSVPFHAQQTQSTKPVPFEARGTPPPPPPTQLQQRPGTAPVPFNPEQQVLHQPQARTASMAGITTSPPAKRRAFNLFGGAGADTTTTANDPDPSPASNPVTPRPIPFAAPAVASAPAPTAAGNPPHPRPAPSTAPNRPVPFNAVAAPQQQQQQASDPPRPVPFDMGLGAAAAASHPTPASVSSNGFVYDSGSGAGSPPPPQQQQQQYAQLPRREYQAASAPAPAQPPQPPPPSHASFPAVEDADLLRRCNGSSSGGPPQGSGHTQSLRPTPVGQQQQQQPLPLGPASAPGRAGRERSDGLYNTVSAATLFAKQPPPQQPQHANNGPAPFHAPRVGVGGGYSGAAVDRPQTAGARGNTPIPLQPQPYVQQPPAARPATAPQVATPAGAGGGTMAHQPPPPRPEAPPKTVSSAAPSAPAVTAPEKPSPALPARRDTMGGQYVHEDPGYNPYVEMLAQKDDATALAQRRAPPAKRKGDGMSKVMAMAFKKKKIK